MKAAIYSRVLETEQHADVQLFFNELTAEKIEPVIFKSFFDQLLDHGFLGRY